MCSVPLFSGNLLFLSDIVHAVGTHKDEQALT
jgi:hypothetical protein